jgi:hypothetical protein
VRPLLGYLGWLFLILGGRSCLAAEPVIQRLNYQPAPAGNPLKGFIPYLNHHTTFPHSVEWDYMPVDAVVKGPDQYEWSPFEAKLEAAAARGQQFYPRFYLEYPGKPTAVPKFLLAEGLTLHRWTNHNTQPLPPAIDHTPPYEDPRLRRLLREFIRALGQRYDGDPRIAFLGLGLLGTWGEWHNHPNAHWFASKTVQTEVLDAYESAFRVTRLVARYPAGASDPVYAANDRRRIGYHDDSFAWATLETGGKAEDWFLVPRLRRAGATGKWRQEMVGGEVRPELWKCLFQIPSCTPPGQEFDRCVDLTHVSWLSYEQVFQANFPSDQRARAERAAQRMGYEFHLVSSQLQVREGRLDARITVTNTGVAPFYYDWPIELAIQPASGPLQIKRQPEWHLTGIQPGEPATVWNGSLDLPTGVTGPVRVLVRVPHPLPKGAPLRFANQEQDATVPGWVTVGTVRP